MAMSETTIYTEAFDKLMDTPNARMYQALVSYRVLCLGDRPLTAELWKRIEESEKALLESIAALAPPAALREE